MTTVRENLIAAKALIDTPEKWAKGPVGVNGLWGSDRHCAHQALCFRGSEAFEAVEAALPFRWKVGQWFRGRWSVLNSTNIIRFNDAPTTTHDDIMALFDRAIAALPLNAEGGDK